MKSNGKTALVTGASSGIGEEIARVLLSDGYRVYAAARRIDRMKALEAAGAKLLPLDVTNDASMQAAMARISQDGATVDVLINNAGYGAFGSVEDMPLDEARRQFEVNVFGLARLTQLVLPAMRKNRAGKIVNITSIAGQISEPFGAWYHATKFAVEGFSDCLRMEVAPFGIDVIIVQPGAIKTEWNSIARTGLLQVSGGGAYGRAAVKHARFLEGADTSPNTSGPEAVAQTVHRALKATRPRTRYATGRGAGTILAVRRWLPDRAFDRLAMMVSQRSLFSKLV